MNTLKTKNEVQQLNFNDLAFFMGISTSDAKWKMAHIFYNSDKELSKNLTKTGVPKISVNDYVSKSEFEKKIKSSTELENKNHIDYHIDFFNKGVSHTKLSEYSQSKSFVKAIKFTGKSSILNDILNRDQMLLLQKRWILSNTYNVRTWSKKAMKFIEDNEWVKSYLNLNMDFDTEYIEQLRKDV